MTLRRVKQSFVLLTGSNSRARTVVSMGPVAPVHARIASATNSRNTTWLLTGFPGKPNSGVPFHNPKSGGDPGRIFTRQ